MKLFKYSLVIIGIIFGLIFLEESEYTTKNIVFWDGNWKIIIPKNNFNKQCFVFVHGDGQISADGSGFYKPYFSEFAKKWYCSFSWDKPKSYKNQTMKHRADEVERAIWELKKHVETEKIFVIWWSQSAWVMWYLDQKKIDGIIQISWAVDWISQSIFMTHSRAKQFNWTEETLKNQLETDKIFDNYLLSGISYQEYLKTQNAQQVWEDNWNFWQKNISEDIRKNYENISVPFIAIFWWKDIHVNIDDSRKIYAEIFDKNKIKYNELFFENANHGLIRTSKWEFIHEWFNGLKNILKIEFFWKYAFPENYFEEILNTIKEV